MEDLLAFLMAGYYIESKYSVVLTTIMTKEHPASTISV